MSRKSVLALTAIAALSTSCLVPTDASARVGAYAARSSHFAGVRASRSVARPAISPPGRFLADAAYDPATTLAMLFGGRLERGVLANDTWAWD